MTKNKTYKILLTGGGTGGSVTPLLAVASDLEAEFKKQGRDLEFFWLGTKYGPEREMVERAGIKFKSIIGGKWRRYFSLENLLDVFKIKIAFWQAFFILLKWQPDLAVSAGSFISVPAVWAARVLGAKVLVHQQDARPGLANKLMSPLAKVVTVTFEKSLADYGKKAVWIGNPVRKQPAIKKYFAFNNDLPIVLILGGGTGAVAINKLVVESLSELVKFCQIVHVTGKQKIISNQKSAIKNYSVYEFLGAEQMTDALKLADLVVTRAGLGFLTELSYLGKPSIIIPMPNSHQEDNAEMFKDASLVLEQKNLTAAKFTAEIKNLIDNRELLQKLSRNIGQVMKPGANQAMVKIILRLLK